MAAGVFDPDAHWGARLPQGELPAAAAGRFGDREALAFQGRRYSFREISAEVDRLARGLIALGVQPGEKVCLWLTNCPEWIFAMFALARVGAVHVPVNTRLRVEDVGYVLRQSEDDADHPRRVGPGQLPAPVSHLRRRRRPAEHDARRPPPGADRDVRRRRGAGPRGARAGHPAAWLRDPRQGARRRAGGAAAGHPHAAHRHLRDGHVQRGADRPPRAGDSWRRCATSPRTGSPRSAPTCRCPRWGARTSIPWKWRPTCFRHPGIRQVAVVGYPDPRLAEVPVAFVLRAPGAAVAAEELIAACRGRIASFKIPRHVLFVDELPLTSSGKVQKAVLRGDALRLLGG